MDPYIREMEPFRGTLRQGFLQEVVYVNKESSLSASSREITSSTAAQSKLLVCKPWSLEGGFNKTSRKPKRLYTLIYIYIYMYVCICIYVYIHIYTYMYHMYDLSEGSYTVWDFLLLVLGEANERYTGLD